MIKFPDISGEDKKKNKKPSSKQKKQDSHHIDFASLDEEELRLDKQKKQDSHHIEFSSLREEKLASQSDVEEREPTVDREELYNEAVALADKVLSRDSNPSIADIRKVDKLIEDLIDCTKNNRQYILECVFASSSEDIHFSSLNSVNVAILSLEIGVGLGYDHSRLKELGQAAFLHDVGMKKHADLINQQRELSPEEKRRIQRHPLDGSDILRRIPDGLDPSTVEIIEQEHERLDESGYPRGLGGNDIDERAQIVGLMDVYEALTHKRPHRARYSTLEAVKIIIENKKSFNPRAIKVFLETIGIYPKGTYVELNTDEVAKVIRQNFKMPSCPVVRAVHDNQGNPAQKERKIDLSKGTTVYITKSL